MSENVLYLHKFAHKRRGDNVCKVLQDIQGKTPSELLEIYNIKKEPPIDIDELIFKMDINLLAMDFSEIEKAAGVDLGSILGATISINNSLNILYCTNNTENRRRFTIAHEIAHCCLHTEDLKDNHVEFRENMKVNNGREYEANIFAGELLIPEDLLHNIHQRLIVPSLDALTKVFKVSSTVMIARLDYLNLPYLKDIDISEA